MNRRASGTSLITTKRVWSAILALLALQSVLVLFMVHRESLTFDEDNHMFAGYMMWKTADYGLNPEHPPLIKLLATLPVLHAKLWVPPLQGRDFKAEAYLDGRDWLARNDGARQRLVFRMRMAVLPVALALSLVVFFAAREWFDSATALVALTLVVFDPDILANSGLVTTDVLVSLFFLASIYAFYRYVSRPTIKRLFFAGLVIGLLGVSKHSGILLVPMLIPVIAWEAAAAEKGQRLRRALRLSGAFCAMIAIAAVVLWAFYGFRYAARPAGLHLSTPLAQYVAPLNHFDQAVVMFAAHLHLLPESYLMGLVDVKRMAQFYPTFIFGHVYAHGVWWYFPSVVLIKETIGLLALCALAVWAAWRGWLGHRRELLYLIAPAAVYFLIAMAAQIDIGARHVLPDFVMASILAAAGAVTLARRSRKWLWVVAVLVVAHIVSSLSAYPHDMAYANELWGGPANTHNLLSDANVDWAQQLYQVKAWQDRNPGVDCWFAYFARPEVDPGVYGIRCHALPTLDTWWLGGSEIVPPQVHGAVLISAGDLSGCEWPSGRLNPYRAFQRLKPAEAIEDAVFVYRGDFDLKHAAALSRAEAVSALLAKHQAQQALPLAQQAVAIAPSDLFAQTALGDVQAALGQKQAALQAWNAALATARKLDPAAQKSYVPDLETKLKKAGATTGAR